MWYLNSKSDSRVIYVLPEQNIIIGRNPDGSNCNFAVPGDPSLSRKHATLNIIDTNLILEDLGSKYGTFINNSTEKVQCNQKFYLNVNDIIKFGKLNCEWKVQKANFVTCTSTLKGENVQNLRITLDKLGGVLKSDWDDSCTYLTMPAITLTIKVVLALVQGTHIVTTDYWNKCYEAISQNSELPNPSLFIPDVVESTLNKENVSFIPNEDRKSLFAGKNIVFFSKRQLEMYKMVLEKSSATALLLSDKKMSKSMLCGDDIIVIQYNITSISQETESQREQIKDIVNYLNNKGKRVVADAEIGLAILYCSIDKYCNPDFNFTLEVLKQSTNQELKNSNILVQESQYTSKVALKQENIKIDESLTSKDNSLVTSGNVELVIGKRKLVEDEITSNVVKKVALENTSLTVTNTGNKRTADDSEDMQINPSKKMTLTSADDDSFNFIKSSNKNTENCTEMFNLMKPNKRKLEHDDEGLFNFVTKKVATEKNANNSNYNHNLNNVGDKDSDAEIINVTRSTDEKIDLTALRGAKLPELFDQNCKMEVKNECMKVIKSEDNDNEEFGTTIVVVRNDLLVKREHLPSKEDSGTSRLKNFKKFKKVWPSKMQESMSKLSISVG